jgi:hypothetical protein
MLNKIIPIMLIITLGGIKELFIGGSRAFRTVSRGVRRVSHGFGIYRVFRRIGGSEKEHKLLWE